MNLDKNAIHEIAMSVMRNSADAIAESLRVAAPENTKVVVKEQDGTVSVLITGDGASKEWNGQPWILGGMGSGSR